MESRGYYMLRSRINNSYNELIVVKNADALVQDEAMIEELSSSFATHSFRSEMELRAFLSSHRGERVLILLPGEKSYLPYDIENRADIIVLPGDGRDPEHFQEGRPASQLDTRKLTDRLLAMLGALSEHIFRLYDFGNEINLAFLKRKMAEGCGDRDVVVRAAGAFVKTLLYFGVMEERDRRMVLKKPLQLSNEQARTILLLWGREIMHTPQISLNNLPEPVFGWFELPDKRALAQRYNGEDWDYQHRMDGDYLMVY